MWQIARRSRFGRRSGTGAGALQCTVRNTGNIYAKPEFCREKNKKYFEHNRLEGEIYGWWEGQGLFRPVDRSNGAEEKPFVVPMPPPNVTGYLHMGHALFASLQDTAVRFHRMRGRETLWLPGTDHAGIATQLLVEKELALTGISRQSIGREAFIDKVWEWKQDKGGGITRQLRRLGASADWSRERFTLETDMSAAVKEAFVRMYEKGLIYRGDYMVNWSPALQTAVSDLEVDYAEEEGFMYHFKYYIVPASHDSSGSISDSYGEADKEHLPIATTRLETVFGDTALCVHPDDERYRHLIGRRAYVPGSSRQIPIIGDPYVDPEFGTGALKITPAHDINDYTIGKTHALESINILNKDGTMNAVAGERYAGLCRFQCRRRVWEDMQRDGTAIRKEPVAAMRVPRSQRGGEVIEPMLSTQWFVQTESMRQRAMAAVAEGAIRILPTRFEKVWHSWLEVDRDWCISRQLWWGHRIPVYYKVGGGAQDFVVARSDEDALVQARLRWGEGVEIVQDEDVLDTWFSSGLWPFATVGWPDVQANEVEYGKYFPAALLETGYDILFFWVARMAMMSLELTGKAPFETVYMHGLVKDHQGNKMSKTKGNVIDPVDSIEAHGCDALRMSLLSGTTPGMDISLSEGKIEANRNFVNKIWNIGKFVQEAQGEIGHVDAQTSLPFSLWDPQDVSALPLLERCIVSRAHEVSHTVTEALLNYKFAEASRDVTDFVWTELADWFIEASKSRLKPNLLSSDASATENNSLQTEGCVAIPSRAVSVAVLLYVWEVSLKLLHPFMPFVTETVWQLLFANDSDNCLMVSNWPVLKGKEALFVDKDAIASFEVVKSAVKAVRNTRAEYNVSPSKHIGAIIDVRSPALRAELQREVHTLTFLGRLNKTSTEFVDFGTQGRTQTTDFSNDYVQLVISEGVVVFLPLSDLIDREKETARLQKQIQKTDAEAEALRSRLSNSRFIERAKPEVVAATRAQLAEHEDVLSALRESLARAER